MIRNLWCAKPRPKRPHEGASFSMVKGCVEALSLSAILLFSMPALGLAQSLPTHFQFRETRRLLDGQNCVVLLDVKVVGSSVLLARLKEDCDNKSQVFSGDEGFIFALNETRKGPRTCAIAAGVSPKMTCSDGEIRTLLGLETTEPLRVDANLSRTASWQDSRLVLDLENAETRFTVQGGSGKKPQKIVLRLHLEFSFSGPSCRFEKVTRTRTLNGKRVNPVIVAPLDCQVLR